MMVFDMKSAYLRQARSDFEVVMSNWASAPRCHVLHYLQMALEKLSKSIMLPPASQQAVFSHAGATKLFECFGRVAVPPARPIQKSVGMGASAWRGYMMGLRNTVQAIELLAPALANQGAGVNCEYPWSIGSGQFVAPADYSFSDPNLSEVRLEKLSLFLRQLFQVL